MTNLLIKFRIGGKEKKGDITLIKSLLTLFLETLFHKISNFISKRIKLSTLVANDLSFQLS